MSNSCCLFISSEIFSQGNHIIRLCDSNRPLMSDVTQSSHWATGPASGLYWLKGFAPLSTISNWILISINVYKGPTYQPRADRALNMTGLSNAILLRSFWIWLVFRNVTFQHNTNCTYSACSGRTCWLISRLRSSPLPQSSICRGWLWPSWKVSSFSSS